MIAKDCIETAYSFLHQKQESHHEVVRYYKIEVALLQQKYKKHNNESPNN